MLKRCFVSAFDGTVDDGAVVGKRVCCCTTYNAFVVVQPDSRRRQATRVFARTSLRFALALIVRFARFSLSTVVACVEYYPRDATMSNVLYARRSQRSRTHALRTGTIR